MKFMHPDEREPAARPIRPQYHFFYGSTEEADTTDHVTSRLRSSTNSEQESLIGESLVPTDNEEEAPSSRKYDLQHVLMSDGNGAVRHVMGPGAKNNGHSAGRKKPFVNGGGHPMHQADDEKPTDCLANLRRHPPMVHIVSLVACMTVCMVVLATTLFRTGSQRAADALGNAGEVVRIFHQTFPTVDRSKSNDPVQAFLDTGLFHPDLLYNPKIGSDPFRVFTFPFPTGAFWTNLVLPPTADRGFSYPIAVYPYAYKWSDSLLVASYPALHRNEQPKAIHDYFQPDLTFGVKEEVQKRYVTNFDPLSVALQFLAGKGTWNSYLVQGSPYVTIEYDSVTPTIQALSTFKNVVCPGETMDSGKDDEFDDIYFTDDEDDDPASRRRRMLGVCGSSTDSNASGFAILRGVQFVLQTQEGVHWIVFASEPITFVFDTRLRTNVVASKAFKGTIRLAIIPPSSQAKESDGTGVVKIYSSTGLRRLVYHASVYPVGAKVDYDFRDLAETTSSTIATSGKTLLSGLTGSVGGTGTPRAAPSGERVAQVHFHFQTKITNGNANAAAVATGKTTDLLMLSLPHHAASLSPNHVLDAKHFDLDYLCIKGAMAPVVGSIWTYEEKLLPVGFEPVLPNLISESAIEATLRNTAIRKLLANTLEDDLKIAMPTRTENVYGFGKQIARLGQLAHIADILVGPENSSNSSGKPALNGLEVRLVHIRTTAMGKLNAYLELLLENQLSDSLWYDASLGGLVSTEGLTDFNADFGNGRYNDHHFHYGYMLYACAMMGKMNATFVDSYGDKVDAIMHDVAHNSNLNDGSFFPLARHMSWFDGHSFASGLFPFANGKSQESSSEAVNCYYAATLWSLVRSGSADNPTAAVSSMTDFARLLLAMEVRGAKTYWHMMPPPASESNNVTSAVDKTLPAVYSPKFAENYMVGNLGMLDVICSTWFGTENLYVHMINLMPVTPVTRELFSKDYVSEEYGTVISQYPNVEMAWRGYVVCDHAILSPMDAWWEALDLISSQLDSGLSKSQVLYFILTSPSGFNVSQIGSGETLAHDDATSATRTEKSSSSGSIDDAACLNHAACVATGLVGLCCPTSAGSFLDCCNHHKLQLGS